MQSTIFMDVYTIESNKRKWHTERLTKKAKSKKAGAQQMKNEIVDVSEVFVPSFSRCILQSIPKLSDLCRLFRQFSMRCCDCKYELVLCGFFLEKFYCFYPHFLGYCSILCGKCFALMSFCSRIVFMNIKIVALIRKKKNQTSMCAHVVQFTEKEATTITNCQFHSPANNNKRHAKRAAIEFPF